MRIASTRRTDNERRVARMKAWICLAEALPASDDNAHVRFVFYWIAYEAAYQTYNADRDRPRPDRAASRRKANTSEREEFHQRATWYDGNRLQGILKQHRESIVKLLELRQVDRKFWYQGNQPAMSDAEWDSGFRKRVKNAVNHLDNLETAQTLNDLFENLSIVRHQIVHGGSAGIQSRGLSQVLWGTGLLAALIPRFRASIKDGDGNYLATWQPRGDSRNGLRLGAVGKSISITVLRAVAVRLK